MSDTTLTQDNFLIDPIDPLSGKPWTPSEIQSMQEGRRRRELVRQRLVAEFSCAPLYQARAAKDPEYWNKFSIGVVR